MATLREFMNARRVTDTTWNITGMGKDAGKYYVLPEEYQEFLHLFYTDVHVNRTASSLLERHSTVSPLLIDLDFRYPAGMKERAFDKVHLEQFLSQFARNFYHFFDYDLPLRFFSMLRPEVTEEKGVVKDGIHIICGDVNFNYSTLHTLRAFNLEKNCLSMFVDRSNTDKDCYDEAVIQRNNWFLYGARKPTNEPYIVDYCHVVGSDGVIQEAEWIETDEDFVQLFSLQYNRSEETPLKLKADKADEWKLWESIANGDRPQQPTKTRKPAGVENDRQSVCTSVSNGICKILKLNGFEWKIDECDDGYKLTHNTNDCLVAVGNEHSAQGHSCVFVQKNHAIISCFSHNTKKLPKSKGDALWRLLNNAEDDCETAYSTMKETFEYTHFRVLNPPGYMTKIDDTWVHYTRQQLIDMNSGLFLDDVKKERFIDWWLRDNTIRTYSKTGYYVDVTECPTTVFNTFAGFAAESLLANYIPSAIDIILNHVKLLCNHNVEAYEFILDWLAILLQRPGFLNGICVIFKGKHGCGKDMFLSWFGTRVVGLHNYYKTARPHIDLFGAFNSSRKDIVFYHIEEGTDAVFKDVNLQQFKNYITDSYASIQLKQKNTTTGDSLVKNYNHFAISTNHVITCEANERRFFGIEASSETCKQPAYFNALAQVMDNPDMVASFYWMLKHRDVSGRNWSELPETEYMKEMRSASLPELFYFLSEFMETQEDDTVVIKASDLYEAYRDWHHIHGTEKVKTSTSFGKEIKTMTGINKVIERNGTFYEIAKDLVRQI
jgi:hypothetical protein